MSIKFEIIEKYKDKNINLPKRATKGSAGYDIEAAEDMIIPSIFQIMKTTRHYNNNFAAIPRYYFDDTYRNETYSIEDIKSVIKSNNYRTMVPTGLKVKMPEDVVLKIHPRSGTGSNCLLQLANQTGVIDSDYYNNPDNEGHIFIPILNLSPYDIKIEKGDKIAQGIFEHYLITDDDEANGERTGGFGSTDSLDIPVGETRIIGNTMYKNDPVLGLICLPVLISDDCIKEIDDAIKNEQKEIKENTLKLYNLDYNYTPSQTRVEIKLDDSNNEK